MGLVKFRVRNMGSPRVPRDHIGCFLRNFSQIDASITRRYDVMGLARISNRLAQTTLALKLVSTHLVPTCRTDSSSTPADPSRKQNCNTQYIYIYVLPGLIFDARLMLQGSQAKTHFANVCSDFFRD
jgi:hypothetical protein